MYILPLLNLEKLNVPTDAIPEFMIFIKKTVFFLNKINISFCETETFFSVRLAMNFYIVLINISLHRINFAQ